MRPGSLSWKQSTGAPGASPSYWRREFNVQPKLPTQWRATMIKAYRIMAVQTMKVIMPVAMK